MLTDDGKHLYVSWDEYHLLTERLALKVHASGQTAQSIKSSAIADHGSLREHFKRFCRACDEAMETIAEAFMDTRMS